MFDTIAGYITSQEARHKDLAALAQMKELEKKFRKKMRTATDSRGTVVAATEGRFKSLTGLEFKEGKRIKR